jgi:KRAB domain-containing zinc finger protein
MPKKDREVFKCQYCDFKSFDKSYIRSAHEKSHFGKDFKCDLCEKCYYTKHRLKAHILEAHEKKLRYKCQFCPKSYFTVDKLKEHELVNHIKKGVRDVLCELCSAAFITNTQLQSHIKTVHTEGVIKCDFEGCTRTFHKMSKKEIHLRVHTRENKHKCEICNQAFPYTWVLSKHKRVVHGIEKNK